MELEIYKDVDDLIRDLAALIQKVSKESIAENGRFNFVLSGGSSPPRLFELLASEPFKDTIDWKKTYFFFGDERFVDEGDSRRNSLMAKNTLFDPLNIDDSHIFKVDTTLSPEASAKNYAERIATHFKNKPAKFDFNLLGLGDNAHTASLFPYSPVLNSTEATVKSVYIKEKDMYRITMTAPLINQSKQIAFLVFGKNKAEAVYHVLRDNDASPQQYPARLILSKSKKVHWFLDTAAASRL